MKKVFERSQDKMKWMWVITLVFLYQILHVRGDSDNSSCTATPGAQDLSAQNSEFNVICTYPKERIGPHKTMPSRCALATYNCQHPKNPYIYRHDGPCNNNPPDECSHSCPDSKKIICAGPSRGSGANITFANRCKLQNFNCERKDNETYVVLYEGECEHTPCHKLCSSQEAPICARSRHGTGELKTFKNSCHLDNYNCDHRSDEYYVVNVGTCGNTTGPCSICNSEYRPICGKTASNEIGKTFENQCELDRFNCLHNTHYEYRHDGRCVRSCTHTCRQDYAPICASSLRGDKPPTTLRNRCYLEQHNCEADINNSDDIYELLYPGECQIPSSTTSRPLNQCPKPCPQILGQICASSKGNPNIRQTFYNRCDLENHNCAHPPDEYVIIHEGSCQPPSSRLCRLQQCSIKDQITICAYPENRVGPNLDFSGNCSLENYNCLHSDTKYIYYHEGSCRPEPSCKKECSTEVLQICGISKGFRSKLTFKNLCEMENYNCDNGLLGKYEVLNYGQCEGDVLPNPPFEPICQKNCPDEYNPVCATPLWGLGLQREFHNQCYLDNYNCEHFLLKFKELHAGKCRQSKAIRTCKHVCTLEYNPICGISRRTAGLNKTFGNQCMMDSYNCEHEGDEYQFLYHGACKTLPSPPSREFSCIKDCECTYNPVCAKSRYGSGLRKEFTNRCKLDNYNCENYLEPYDIVNQGKCSINNIPELPSPLKICIKDCGCEHEPVCAAPRNQIGSRISFTNKCKLDNFNCEQISNPYYIVHNGLCPQSEKMVELPTINIERQFRDRPDDCIRECFPENRPVCGKLRNNIGLIDMKRTFKNQCELEKHNCLFKFTIYDILHDGPCAEAKTEYL